MKIVTWWSPQGFVFEDEPAAFLAIKDQTGDWAQILKNAGYESWGSHEPSALELTIYKHLDGKHFLVEIWDWSRCLSSFFVAEIFENVFFATWYVEFMSHVAQIEQAEKISDIEELIKKLKR